MVFIGCLLSFKLEVLLASLYTKSNFSNIPKTPWVLRNSWQYLYFFHISRTLLGTCWNRKRILLPIGWLGKPTFPVWFPQTFCAGISSLLYCRRDAQVWVIHLASGKHPWHLVRRSAYQHLGPGQVEYLSSLRHYWNPSFHLGLLWHPPHRDVEEYTVTTKPGKLSVHCSPFLSINVDLFVARKGRQFMFPSCLLMKWLQYRLVLHNRSHFSVLKI